MHNPWKFHFGSIYPWTHTLPGLQNLGQQGAVADPSLSRLMTIWFSDFIDKGLRANFLSARSCLFTTICLLFIWEKKRHIQNLIDHHFYYTPFFRNGREVFYDRIFGGDLYRIEHGERSFLRNWKCFLFMLIDFQLIFEFFTSNVSHLVCMQHTSTNVYIQVQYGPTWLDFPAFVWDETCSIPIFLNLHYLYLYCSL